jgi:ABC-type nitrate/sulfonate/bicarbonate transport system ATPase subunit
MWLLSARACPYGGPVGAHVEDRLMDRGPRRRFGGIPDAPSAPSQASRQKLTVEGLSVTFQSDAGGDFEAVRDLSLGVANREFLAILGRSGCGKSTLFNVIAGLIEPSAGTVRLNAEVINGRAGHVGYMMQRDHLFPWRTVRENVVLGLDVLGENRRESRRRAQAMIPRFGLSGFEDYYPAALSGGMRQRAALMRTMLLDRDLLLLDEPFGALDAITRAEMQAWLLKIWEEFRRTVLFITHDVEEAVFLSDRVVVMGGPPGTVMAAVDVEIESPRSYAEVVTSTEFVRVKHEILDVISGEPR